MFSHSDSIFRCPVRSLLTLNPYVKVHLSLSSLTHDPSLSSITNGTLSLRSWVLYDVALRFPSELRTTYGPFPFSHSVFGTSTSNSVSGGSTEVRYDTLRIVSRQTPKRSWGASLTKFPNSKERSLDRILVKRRSAREVLKNWHL